MARFFDDALTQYLEHGAAILAAPPLAVCLQFKTDDVGILQGAFTMGNAATGLSWRLQHYGTSGARIGWSAANRVALSATSYTADTWYHACGIEAGTDDRRVFLDGAGKGTSTQAEVITPDITRIGCRTSGSPNYTFSGAIAEVAVFDLSIYPGADDGARADYFEAQILPSLAAGYSPLSFPGLAAYWPLGGLEGDHDRDVVGQCDTQPYNGPTWADHPSLIYPGRALSLPVDISLPSVDYPGSRADAIRIWAGGVEADQLRAVGTIPGVRVDRVGGANGPGAASLRYTRAGLAWAPPAGPYGAAVPVPADGAYLIEGPEPGQFARVTVWGDYLRPGAEAPVHLVDRFNNGVSSDDVDAAEASAGDVETYQLTLRNESGAQIADLRLWLDPACDYLEISDDGAGWTSATSEEAALQLGNLAPGALATLHVRRTIPASEPYDPEILSLLHCAFDAN